MASPRDPGGPWAQLRAATVQPKPKPHPGWLTVLTDEPEGQRKAMMSCILYPSAGEGEARAVSTCGNRLFVVWPYARKSRELGCIRVCAHTRVTSGWEWRLDFCSGLGSHWAWRLSGRNPGPQHRQLVVSRDQLNQLRAAAQRETLFPPILPGGPRGPQPSASNSPWVNL